MITGTTVVIFTSELEKLADFYEKAFGVKGQSAGPSLTIFRFGQAEFYLHRATANSPTDADPYHLNFITNDINADFERFKAQGAQVMQEIKDESFGKVATLRDPQGREFDLVQPNA